MKTKTMRCITPVRVSAEKGKVTVISKGAVVELQPLVSDPERAIVVLTHPLFEGEAEIVDLDHFEVVRKPGRPPNPKLIPSTYKGGTKYGYVVE